MKRFLFDLKNVWLYGFCREARVKLSHNEAKEKSTLTCRGRLHDLEVVLRHIANNNNIPFNATEGYNQLERLKKICKIKQSSSLK